MGHGEGILEGSMWAKVQDESEHRRPLVPLKKRGTVGSGEGCLGGRFGPYLIKSCGEIFVSLGFSEKPRFELFSSLLRR